MGGGEADECKRLILKLKHIFGSTLVVGSLIPRPHFSDGAWERGYVVGPLHGAAMWKLYTVNCLSVHSSISSDCASKTQANGRRDTAVVG